MQCKSLWIKASAKCLNVNVNVMEEPYRPSWPLGPLYTVSFLFILSLKIVQMLIFACKMDIITFN